MDPASSVQSPSTQARLSVYENGAIFLGILAQNRTHAHHALQYVIAFEGNIDASVQGRFIRAPGILIRPNVPHCIHTTDSPLGIILMEPIVGNRRMLDPFEDDYSILEDAARESIVDSLRLGDYAQVFRQVEQLTGSRALDPRVDQIVRHISKEERCRHQIRFFARRAGLSESRISHLFSREIGVSLKHFILWKKLLFAIDSLRTATDLTEIALDCGFSDLPHLSRTFRRMFGHSLTEVFGQIASHRSSQSVSNSSSVQVDFQDLM